MRAVKNNFYSFNFVLLLVGSTFFSKCSGPSTKNPEFPYKISQPDKKYLLQHSLAEVSGLSFISDKEVALIQDEDGKIFYFDLEKGVITRKISFAKDGDYEDLKIAGDTAYILRSDGKIFEVTNLSSTSSAAVNNKYATGLSSQNDTEGLCYDDKHNRLLVACKGSPGIDKKYKNNKAIYSFDLASKKMSAAPVYLINVNSVEKLAHGGHNSVIHNFMKLYRKSSQKTFQPSGISVHPFTRDLYIISSASSLLVVLDSLGTIKNVEKLPSGVFKQPEGIGFDSAGNLYISNEGRKGKGNILKFLYLKDQTS